MRTCSLGTEWCPGKGSTLGPWDSEASSWPPVLRMPVCPRARPFPQKQALKTDGRKHHQKPQMLSHSLEKGPSLGVSAMSRRKERDIHTHVHHGPVVTSSGQFNQLPQQAWLADLFCISQRKHVSKILSGCWGCTHDIIVLPSWVL